MTTNEKTQVSIAWLLGLTAIIAVEVVAVRLVYTQEPGIATMLGIAIAGSTCGGVIGFLCGGWRNVPLGIGFGFVIAMFAMFAFAWFAVLFLKPSL